MDCNGIIYLFIGNCESGIFVFFIFSVIGFFVGIIYYFVVNGVKNNVVVLFVEVIFDVNVMGMGID